MDLSFQEFNGLRIFENTPPDVEITTEFQKTKKGYLVTRSIRNIADHTIKLYELWMLLEGIDFGKDARDDYFYCNENHRVYGTMTLPLDHDSRICNSPYQPFPAVLISNYQSKKGIIVGSLSQEVFFHNFEAGHGDNGSFLKIYASFKDIDYRLVQPGEELKDSFCILETDCADDINHLFDNYTAILRTILPHNCGAGQANRHTMLWDSWNDGIYRDVSEEMLVKEAKAVKKLFPNVEWFQLDDGYASLSEKNVDLAAHGLGVAYEGEEGVDREKFPNGLRGYSDKIKEVGLKPSLWIGGFCPVQSRIYKEHPEWFIDYTYRVDFSQPLDVSRQDVRDYMTYALDVLISEAGFEGVKHDFWSYAFEDSHNLLQGKEKSGYEYREWWHKELRRRLPSYGYLQTGCDVCTGNPFLGKYFNNYRFGLDVGAGEWENMKTTMFWGMAVLPTHTGDLFIPNSDSIGLLPNLNDRDFLFVVNYQIITRTLVEISGRFSRKDMDQNRLQIIQRATKYINNGEDVFFLHYDYRQKGQVLPEIIYINSAFDRPKQDGDREVKTVALFNASQEDRVISFTVKELGMEKEAKFTEVWSGEESCSDGYSCVLPPHGSKLLLVKAGE